MCGIFGFIGKKDQTADENKLKVLSLYNVSRGFDATGIITFQPGKTYFQIRKDIISAFEFNVKYPFMYKEQSHFIGHTRAKTVGPNIIANAHPFMGEHIGGVHNGTLTNHHYMYDQFREKNNDIRTKATLGSNISDSKMLYELFNNEGLTPVLQAYEGALAMMAFDKLGTLFVYHDSNRPLHVGKSSEGLYFSSEAHPLASINCTDISYIEEEKLYEFVEGEQVACRPIDRSKPMVKPEPPKKKTSSSKNRTEGVRNHETRKVISEVVLSIEEREIKEIKSLNSISDRNLEMVINGTTVFVPFDIIEDDRRQILTFQDGAKLLTSGKGKSGSLFLWANYRDFEFSSTFLYEDETGVYIYIDFVNHINEQEHETSFITLRIKDEFVKEYNEKFNDPICLFDPCSKVLTVNGKKGWGIRELISSVVVDILDLELMKGVNAYAHCGPSVFPSCQASLPFNPDPLQQDIKTMGTLVKAHFGRASKFKKHDEAIIKIDDKYMAIKILSDIKDIGRINCMLLDPRYSDVRISIKSKYLLTHSEYLHDIADEYNDIIDIIEDNFDDAHEELTFDNFERQVAIDSIFAGLPFRKYGEEMMERLEQLEETDSSLDVEGKQIIKELLTLTHNQNLRGERTYEAILKHKREISKITK